MLLYYMHGWIHLSLGRADRWLRWGFIEVAVTSLLFLAGLPWGPTGIAAAWTASFWILTIPAFWYAGKPIQLGVGPVVAAIWKYLLSSLLAGSATVFLIHEIPLLVATSNFVGAVIQIVTRSILFGCFYVSTVVLLHGGYAPLSQLTELLQEMIPHWRFWKPSSIIPVTCRTDLG